VNKKYLFLSDIIKPTKAFGSLKKGDGARQKSDLQLILNIIERLTIKSQALK